jgi:hypothetical protein
MVPVFTLLFGSLLWEVLSNRFTPMVKVVALIICTIILIIFIIASKIVTKIINTIFPKKKKRKIVIKLNPNIVRWSIGIVLCIVAIVLEGFVYQNSIIVILSPAPNPTTNVSLPTYMSASTPIMISLGQDGATGVVTWGSFSSGNTQPIGGLPIVAYVKNNQLQVNVTFYGDKDNPQIAIDPGDMKALPRGWDFNYDSTAFEVVNSDQQPVF